MLKVFSPLLIIAGMLNVLIVVSQSGLIAVIAALASIITIFLGCFIAHYLKHISKHAPEDAISRSECGRVHELVEKRLCSIIKHFGIEEE